MTNETEKLLESAYANFEKLVTRGERKWKMKDLMYAVTGTGFMTEFKTAIKEGYFTHANKPRVRRKQDWRLTEKGAEFVMQMHESKSSK